MYSAVLREFHRIRKPALPPLSNAYIAGPLIAKLRKTWHRLHDVDRALAVREIIQLGLSRRRLALEIGFSEGLLRRLLKCLEASPSDINLARQNLISTNELARRARSTAAALPESPVSALVQPSGESRRRQPQRSLPPDSLISLSPARRLAM